MLKILMLLFQILSAKVLFFLEICKKKNHIAKFYPLPLKKSAQYGFSLSKISRCSVVKLCG